MANTSDLSGDEREQRIAELKKKMQQAAQRNKAAAETKADQTSTATEPSPTTAGEATAEDSAPVAVAAAQEESATEAADPQQRAGTATVRTQSNGASGNGYHGNGVASATNASVFKPADAMSEEQLERREMNRREFLTYAWGGAMGLLALQAGVVSFLFMYPRFKAGEFGGKFFMGAESAVPPADSAPVAVTDGKFWWVNIEGEGPAAIYMVCTHLGCLYKWVGENNRFECPCHGSKFTREGDFIEGPAPRSLDRFETVIEDGEYVVDTGARINGAPAAESPAAGTG